MLPEVALAGLHYQVGLLQRCSLLSGPALNGAGVSASGGGLLAAAALFWHWGCAGWPCT